MVRANQLAYQYIREKILDGTYRPAQRLIEAQLAEEIGVSRNTIKKAFLKLSEEKLIVIEDNKGASVVSLSLEEVLQYYEVRRSLEMLVLESAAANISNEELMELESIYNEMVVFNHSGDYNQYSAYNRRFHDIIYNASGKNVAVEMIRGIKTQLSRFQLRTIIVPGRAESSLKEHENLLNALKMRNKTGAVNAIETHLNNIMTTIVEYKNLFL